MKKRKEPTAFYNRFQPSAGPGKKLEFHNVFKGSYTPSIYLDVTRKNPNRKALVKLRIRNHKPNIETGRYDKISRCDRICPVCALNIEDEIRFLFDCPKYSSIRDDFFLTK